MKKIITFAVMLISATAFAADRPASSKISANSKTNSTLTIKIDGRTYDLYRNAFVLNNINAGNHSIEIYKTETVGRFRRPRTEVIYSSSVFIQPMQSVDIDITRNDRVTVSKVMPVISNDRNRNGYPYGNNDRNGRNDNNYGKNGRY